MLDRNSDEPFPHAFSRARMLISGFPSLRRLSFLRRKYTMGNAAPKIWLTQVAAAAPASPNLKTATNSASSTMFITPAIAVTISPSRAFSATTKKLWKMFCRIKKVCVASINLP